MIGFPHRVFESPRGPDVGWALDQLFSDAPWEHPQIARVPTVWGVLQANVNLALPDLTDPQTRDDFMKQKLWVLFRRVRA